jgi:glycosyltransferase involved in cell wall biosynthesis
MKKKLAIVQPIITSYRVPLFSELSNNYQCKVDVYAERPGPEFGNLDNVNFNFKEIKWKNFFKIKLINFKILKELETYNEVIHVGNFRYLTLWWLLVYSLFSNTRVWLHGHGGYKRNSILSKLIYFFSISMADGYICYTKFSQDSLKKKLPLFLHKKIYVCENTLDIEPVDKIEPSIRPRILYIGRLRESCGIEILLNAAIQTKTHVEIVGEGEKSYVMDLKRRFSQYATFYGAIFDEIKLKEISRTCLCGAYGGDAGLSVVHFMALGLPVIVHEDINCHMGPEPSYVIDKRNGLTFKRKNVLSLANKITFLLNNNNYRNRLALGALQTFRNINNLSMAEKFSRIIGLRK